MRSGTHCRFVGNTKTVIARGDGSLQRTSKSDLIDWPVGNGRGVSICLATPKGIELQVIHSNKDYAMGFSSSDMIRRRW